jgi:hypothetical protein
MHLVPERFDRPIQVGGQRGVGVSHPHFAEHIVKGSLLLFVHGPLLPDSGNGPLGVGLPGADQPVIDHPSDPNRENKESRPDGE